MTGLMTKIVVKAKGITRKQQAVLQLASKRDINDILRLFYEEGWVDYSRDDLDFLFDTSPKCCFKYTVDGELVGVTFATLAGGGICYPHSNLVGGRHRDTVNYFAEATKYDQYLRRINRVEMIYAARKVIGLYRDGGGYQPICTYRRAVIDTTAVTKKPVAARAATDADLPGVFALCREIYKADREPLIRHFLGRGLAQAFVLSAEHGVDAYAMVRRLPKAYALGPVLANDPQSAVDVVAAAAHAYAGQHLVIDGNEENLQTLLADGIGYRWEDTVMLKMYRGDKALLEDEGRIYGIFARYIS
jgi:hypothetical protein